MFWKISYQCQIVISAFACLSRVGYAQQAAGQSTAVPLRVVAGTPLRLYITNRVWFRTNEPVSAKFAEPVWAFDRIVIPAGTVVQGHVAALDPVSGMMRAKAILGGDFTPLKQARVAFTSLTLPDGRSVTLHAQDSVGLNLMYAPPRPGKKQKQKSGGPRMSAAQSMLRRQAEAQINTRSRGFYDFIRGPNKREWIENFLVSKLPYHPQWYRSRTRFDAILDQALDFGDATLASDALRAVGIQPPPDSVAQMRILSTITSADARVGEPLEGVLSAPLFTNDHKLVLPEGTRLNGKITLTQRARMFHRGGKLRFTLDDVQPPAILAHANEIAPQGLQQRSEAVQAQLNAVEADPKALKVDQEGTAKATESKTRLLRPVIAGLVAAKAADNDAGKHTASGTGDANTSGRALGGFSGFGLLGIAASRGPREIALSLGYYGLAWSVYTNIISRGREVTFEKNANMAIRFGAAPRQNRK